MARLPGPSPLEATALSGTTATLTLSHPLPSPVGNGTPVFLAREGVVAYGTVSGSTASTLTVTLGSSCVQALSQGGTGIPVRVFLLKEKSLSFDPGRRVFTLTDGNRSLWITVLWQHYPLLVGKDGSTEATMEWVTHYWGPKDLRPLRDPYEYQERMERDPDPQAYKAYTFSRTYRAVLAPGRNVRMEAGAFRAERAPQYDSRPLGRGYNTYTVEMAEYWRYPLQRNIWPTPPSPEEKDRLYRMQFYWENTPYYAFQEGSGIITPPMPICQPGLGYRVNVVAGYAQFRNLLFPYDQYPLETYDRASPIFPGSVVPYVVHLVQLVGRENPEVINYDQFGSATGFGANPNRYYTVEFRPEGRPGYVYGAPSDLARYPLWGEDPPGRTFRVAVLYRFTLGHPDPEEWKPNPSHPPGEDNWYIVWSDVRIAGTRDNPQCSVEAIGYHPYDEVTSRELDAYFGLRDMPLPSGDLRGYFYTTLPSLSRLNPYNDVGYLAVPTGSVTLPDWAFPPGW